MRTTRPSNRPTPERRFSRGVLARAFPYVLGFALVVLAVTLHSLTAMPITYSTLRLPDGQTRHVVFPFEGDAPSDSLVEFSFHIRKRPFTQRNVLFVPDDSFRALMVNGQQVPLGGVPPRRLEYDAHGFSFPLGDYLRPGDNLVTASVFNRGGPVGLDVRPDIHDWQNELEGLSSASGLALVVVVTLRSLGWTWPLVVPFAFGLAARLAYLFVTPFWVRSHDVEAHLEYIEYVLTHHSLPGPYDGWSFYQPPLYYVAGAALWSGLQALGVQSRETVHFLLQLQSVFYQLIFLAFSLCTVDLWLGQVPEARFGRRLCGRSAFTGLAAGLLCVWPSGVIHSIRIGNDDLLYLFFGAGVFFASRWWISARKGDFNTAALLAAFAMLTKTSGLLLFVLLAVLLGVRFALDPERKLGAYLRWAWPSVGLFLASTLATLGRAAIDTASGRRPNLLIGNADKLEDRLAVGNRAMNYLWFDTKIFVTHPFFNPYDDESGRQFFWNSTLKTSLFGEFAFDQARLIDLATVLSVLFLVMLGYFAAGVAGRETRLTELPAICLVAILFASLAGLRMSVPMACSSDFRYVLPALTPFVYLYVRALVRFRELGWTRLSSTGAVVGWSFAALSSAFFAVLVVKG